MLIWFLFLPRLFSIWYISGYLLVKALSHPLSVSGVWDRGVAGVELGARPFHGGSEWELAPRCTMVIISADRYLMYVAISSFLGSYRRTCAAQHYLALGAHGMQDTGEPNTLSQAIPSLCRRFRPPITSLMRNTLLAYWAMTGS